MPKQAGPTEQNCDALAKRVEALEISLRTYKIVAATAGAILVSLLGVQSFWQIPRLVKESHVGQVKEQIDGVLKSANEELQGAKEAREEAGRLNRELADVTASLKSENNVLLWLQANAKVDGNRIAFGDDVHKSKQITIKAYAAEIRRAIEVKTLLVREIKTETAPEIVDEAYKPQ